MSLNPLDDLQLPDVLALLKENFTIFHDNRLHEERITGEEWATLLEGKRRLTTLGYFNLKQDEQSRLYTRSIFGVDYVP